jgi:hypothetical protein
VPQPSDSIGDTVQLVIGPGYSTVIPVEIGAQVVEAPAEPSAEPAPAPEPAAVSCS